MAEQAREFTLRDVVTALSEKLIRRHPHVFGDGRAKDSHTVRETWERLKLTEGRASVLDGVPRHLPALQRAMRVQEKAGRVGFEWEQSGQVWKKVEEEVGELKRAVQGRSSRRREEEFGDLLFALVNYARYIDVNPENALRGTTAKFSKRFSYIERRLKKLGKDVHSSTLEEMDGLWEEAKRRGI
jgi:XTP/dITP diphosphohydrolase